MERSLLFFGISASQPRIVSLFKNFLLRASSFCWLDHVFVLRQEQCEGQFFVVIKHLLYIGSFNFHTFVRQQSVSQISTGQYLIIKKSKYSSIWMFARIKVYPNEFASFTSVLKIVVFRQCSFIQHAISSWYEKSFACWGSWIIKTVPVKFWNASVESFATKTPTSIIWMTLSKINLGSLAFIFHVCWNMPSNFGSCNVTFFIHTLLQVFIIDTENRIMLTERNSSPDLDNFF